ncbi:methyl-accepting chemotaxis protein [Paenibacillus polymyxa]|uniref:methyl-accepting chemotaxis protein n=1 Tax=Paenibacillus polymyxa TaxID=1406 RepID=UPI003D2E6245
MKSKVKKRMGLQSKLYFILLIPLVVIGVMILWTTKLSIQNASLSTMQLNNEALAVNTAKLLDKSAVKSLNTNPSEQSSEYKKLRNELNTLRLQSGVLYMYMYNRVGDEWKLTVDGAAWDDKDYSPFGSPVSFTRKETADRLKQGETVTTDITTDPDWGTMFSSFTPIKDTDGTIIGYLGIDRSLASVTEVYEKTLPEAYRLVIPVVSIILIISIAAMMLVTRRILRQVRFIKDTLEQVADGNLTATSQQVTYDQLGEISDLTNRMVEAMSNMIVDIQSSSSTLQQASENIVVTSEGTLHQTEELSRTLQQIADVSTNQADQTIESVQQSDRLGQTLDEVGSHVHQFTDTARHLNEVRNQVASEHELLLEKGRESALRIKQMQRMSHALTEKSREAANIGQQVQGIVKQTQILSFNASIEASRAGEAGKGFSVVAHEMGQLAQQSAISIREIDEILSSFVEQIEQMGDQFDENINTVNEQEKQIALCLQSVDKVTQVSEEVEELAAHLAQLTTEMQEVRHSVDQHLKHTASAAQQTAGMTEDVSASAQKQALAVKELSEVARNLTTLSNNLQRHADQFRVKSSDQ